MFDPIDDGTTEDDFFDPSDPNRRLGPSSTCFPEFVWAASGDTGGPFDETDVWRADGPGLQGSAGIGTWVETQVDLERFRGRRIRLRFLTTGINDPVAETWEELFAPLNPNDCDDGWWIDDIVVTDTLESPATVAADTKPNSGFPDCGATICDAVVALLTADPEATASNPLAAPGRPVEMDAGTSYPDPNCIGGVLQYRFWIDTNGNDVGGDAEDLLLRDWTDNPTLFQAPEAGTTTYVLDARCSSAPSCADTVARDVVVSCPGGSSTTPLPGPTISAPDKTRLVWSATDNVSYVGGLLAGLGSYATTVGGAFPGADSIPLGDAEWYLVKGPDTCNGPSTWQSSNGAEPGRDLALP
jgi:hypothetical protein